MSDANILINRTLFVAQVVGLNSTSYEARIEYIILDYENLYGVQYLLSQMW